MPFELVGAVECRYRLTVTHAVARATDDRVKPESLA